MSSSRATFGALRQDLLASAIAQKHGALRPANVRALLSTLEKLSESETKWSIGTVCSGTDMPVHALRKLIAFWSAEYGIPINVRHAFSC